MSLTQREVGLNQHFLARVKHWQVQASLSLVPLGHQTLEQDSAAVPGSDSIPGSWWLHPNLLPGL